MKAYCTRLTAFFLILALIALSVLSCQTLATAPTITTPLVVAYDTLSENFNPFFAVSAYDMEVVSMTQVSLLTTDRVGAIIYNAIGGETISYNGKPYKYTGIADIDVVQNTDTAVYKIELKKGVRFSDGEEMTADDIIFNYYVYLDPDYVGSVTLSSYAIVGLRNYLTQTSDEVYTKYETFAADIFAAGEGHKWTSSDTWTEGLQIAFWNEIKRAWTADIESLVDFCVTNYLHEYASLVPGKTPAEITTGDGLRVAFAMALWGYGEIDESGALITAVNEKAFDLKNTFPTVEDFYNECHAAYGGDPVKYWDVEKIDETDVLNTAIRLFIAEYGSKDALMTGGGIPSVEGIKKTGKYTVEVTAKGYEAPAVYSICAISVAPLHYYGDLSKYDYDKNMFGHDFGDLSVVREKTRAPMGAGAYKFIKHENETVYFEANESYYKGCPKIASVQFKEMLESDKITAVRTGEADIANPSGSKAKFEEIRAINGGELNGKVITTSSVDNLGYGYIGLNAGNICAGGDSGSDASKNLRRAIATVISVYRDVAINSYYGNAASVINYPISNTSWAAPQKSDPDYKTAFSAGADGRDIYTGDMNAEEKYAAALRAATDFFKAAGYTWDEGAGIFTAAPAGAKLSYEVLIPADGIGDHPSFQVISNAAGALKTIGITLEINDLADYNVILDRLDAGTQEIWVAAWDATVDPDMYQIYHSSGIKGEDGNNLNYYHIADAGLDRLIADARKSPDQDYRKSTYKTCLDIIMDWACEIPVYQRQNIIILSTERVNIDTVTPDITTYWKWTNDIELLEVYEEKAA